MYTYLADGKKPPVRTNCNARDSLDAIPRCPSTRTIGVHPIASRRNPTDNANPACNRSHAVIGSRWTRRQVLIVKCDNGIHGGGCGSGAVEALINSTIWIDVC